VRYHGQTVKNITYNGAVALGVGKVLRRGTVTVRTLEYPAGGIDEH